jgi:hypothetical protein
MKESARTRLLFGALAIVVVAGCIALLLRSPGAKPPPSESGTYYVGPKKNKSGKDVFVNEDGKPFNVQPTDDSQNPRGKKSSGAPQSDAE